VNSGVLLGLKIFLSPLLMLIVTRLQARNSAGAGGRFMGWPLVTGPIIFIIFLQEGADFAAKTAHGALLGQISLIVFAWSYALTALRAPWYISITTASVIYIGSVYLISLLNVPLWLTFALLILSLILVNRFWPKYDPITTPLSSPRWELYLRIILVITLVFVLSEFSQTLGPGLTGGFSTYPVIATIMGTFNHKRFGASAAIALHHGLMQRLYITTIILGSVAVFL
jgi:hypothetical protein